MTVHVAGNDVIETVASPPPVVSVAVPVLRRPPEPPAVDATIDGFEQCVERWTAELARLAYLLTGDHDAADDLVADALLSAWRQWATVAAADNPKAYVRRIVVNQAASRIRSVERGRRGLRLLSGLADDAAPAPDVSDRLDMRRALDTLPRGQRLCLVLRHGMDLSESEVADVLQISIGTVKSQTFKGIRRLRKLLESPA